MKRFVFSLGCLLFSTFLFAQCISGDCENGTGTARILTGTYVGAFKDGQPEGKGVFEGILFNHPFRDSIKDEGLFEAGIFISGSRNIIARWDLYPDNQYNTNYRNNRKENGSWLVPYDRGLGLKPYPTEGKFSKNGKDFRCYKFNDLATKTSLQWTGSLKNGLMHGEGELSSGDPLRKTIIVKFDKGKPVLIKNISHWRNKWASEANYMPFNIFLNAGNVVGMDLALNGDTLQRRDSLSIYELFCLDNATATSGLFTKKFKTGFSYTGMLKYANPHGYGELSYPNGKVYKGYFYEGFFSGNGATSNQNGITDSGYYQYNRLLRGVVVRDGVSQKFPNCLSGNCIDGFGKASYQMSAADTIINTYEGNFVNGLPNGEGTKLYTQGKYTYTKKGVFSSGWLNGEGNINANFGLVRRLQGTFINDTMLVGTMLYNDGSSFTYDANYYFRKDFRDMEPVVFGFITQKIVGGKGVYVTQNGSILTGMFNSAANQFQVGTYKNATGIEISNFGFENDQFKYLNLPYSYNIDAIDNYVNAIVGQLKWKEDDRKRKAAEYAIDKERDRIFAGHMDNPANYKEEYASITCSACNGLGYSIYSFSGPGNEYVYESNGYGKYKKKLVATFKQTTTTTTKCSACNGRKAIRAKVNKYIGPPR